MPATNDVSREKQSTSVKYISLQETKLAQKNLLVDDDLTAIELLGEHIFFDPNLSEPAGQSCGSCHAEDTGFADPDIFLPVSEGVIPGNFGGRNALSAGYQRFTPSFDIGGTPDHTHGGLFWDGRKLDLEDQAKAPFLNPLEMNNPSLETVVADVMVANYAPLFLEVFGPTAFDDPVMAYEYIAQAIAAFERSEETNEFSSKYDFFKQGLVDLTAEESMGLTLFTGKAMCSHCHVLASQEDPLAPDLFSDYHYANIGLPRNNAFPFDTRPADEVDLGLGAITLLAEHNGKFKTPHLRNVAQSPPYMHNGLFNSLEDVVRFYNTRDVAGMWPPPEVSENLAVDMMGDLGLTEDEEEAIVEFLLTLTDDYVIPPVAP